MAQQEFDELEGIIVHMYMDGRECRALCSGEVIDPRRWIDDTKTVRKQCQACLVKFREIFRDGA